MTKEFCDCLAEQEKESFTYSADMLDTIQKKHGLSKYHTKAAEIASVVSEKQAAYGDSFGRAGNCLREMYPDGIKPEQYDDLLTIARVLDKLFRVANKKDAFGESPYADICGYALLEVAKK